MPRVVLVVPCFNEERRLDLAAFSRLLEDPALDLLFVDDGSTDGTRALLEAHAARSGGRVTCHALPRNAGKGEAVRQGLLLALSRGAAVVGYADADLATPPEELRRLANLALEGTHDVVMGCRVARAGANIERKASRHYLGRAFATYASLVLDESVYDTQCGAKFLRATPTLERALAAPFVARWVFDVELLSRLRYDGESASRWLEVPLERWRDVSGSHLRVRSVPGILREMAIVAADAGRRRGRRG